MQKFINPEINILVFDKTDIIIVSGTVEEAKEWMQSETGSAGAVSTGNVADFASIYE